MQVDQNLTSNNLWSGPKIKGAFQVKPQDQEHNNLVVTYHPTFHDVCTKRVDVLEVAWPIFLGQPKSRHFHWDSNL